MMQNGDWNKVKEVLDEVLQIEPAGRRAFLDGAELDSDVRAEVESLLAFDDQSADLMQLSAVEFSKDFVAEDPSLLTGQEIGPYRLIGELGIGGMGAVYLAERADGKFKQQVALKLLKREMNTSTLRRYFEQEREILASLEHPNIARLLDAGTTSEQIPFIAMEYVDGVPIDEYSSSMNLGLNARLELFRTVCAAVEYAHRNLVVHRDLKPSNILVTKEGVPKLLDFGISKIVAPGYKSADAATITRLGVMTPSYASPEQLQQTGVTTLSDVYSLGVILFELLSGHRPFEQNEGNLRDIYSAVIESQPAAPSSLIDIDTRSRARTGSEPVKSSDGDTAVAVSRKTLPAAAPLSSQLIRGDLDNVVLKALRKEPERRYASAGLLSDDIRRHLEGLTVTARPNTLGYRASKFVARNRIGVAAALLLIIAVLAGLLATLWQARVARAERERAERRFNDVRSLANSFLFEFSPKIEKLPGSTDARRLLVTRALEYLDRLSQEGGDDGELRGELAKAYEKVGDVQGSPSDPNIGDTAGALDSYQKSLAIREPMLAQDPTNVSLIAGVGYINKAIGQIHSIGGDYAKSAPSMDKAVELYEKVAAVEPTVDNRAKLAEMYRIRGLLPFYEGDNKKAIEFYERARTINDQIINEKPDDPRIGEQHDYIYVAIGEARGWDNDFEGASVDLQKGLDLLTVRSARFPNDQQLRRALMLAYNKRAENFQDLEKFDKSVETFGKGVAIAESIRKADAANILAVRDVAMGYKKLAQAMDDAGRTDESIAKLSEAVSLFSDIARTDPTNTEASYDVANTRSSLGVSYLSNKNFEKALETMRQADQEFAAVVQQNPKNIYAMRMSSQNLDQIGKCYYEMAKAGNYDSNLRLAVENFRLARDRYKIMQANGNFAELDLPRLVEIEKLITEMDVKLKA